MSTKVSKEVLKLALIILNRYRKDWAEYEEACEAAWKEGYRPHYCFHGVNLWTDYDPMCGVCEEYGGMWDYKTYAGFALDEAIRAHKQQEERVDQLVKLMTMGAPIQMAELGAWATQPVQKYFPKEEQKVGYAALAKVDPTF